MRRAGLAACLLGLGFLPAAGVALAEGQPARFTLEASLQPALPTSSDGRFRLRAQAIPHDRPAADAARLRAKLSLTPAGLDTCRFPVRVFRDGFESLP